MWHIYKIYSDDSERLIYNFREYYEAEKLIAKLRRENPDAVYELRHV